MKKFLLALATLFFAALSTSCEVSDMEVEYDYNRSVGIIVKNATGKSLFDPNVEGNLLENEITVEYNGVTYPLSEDTGWRYFGQGPYLAIGPYDVYGNDEIMLRFGAFRDDEENRRFTIDWGDGTNDVVEFNYTVTYKTVVDNHVGGPGKERYNKAFWHYKIWVDGVLASDDSLIAEILK